MYFSVFQCTLGLVSYVRTSMYQVACRILQGGRRRRGRTVGQTLLLYSRPKEKDTQNPIMNMTKMVTDTQQQQQQPF